MGIPTFNRQSQTTYSCVADENCNYDVHIISNYEGDGHTGFRIHNTGNTNVRLSVSGQGSKPLILVFVSYEPVNWILSIPSGVVIDKVLLVGDRNIHNMHLDFKLSMCRDHTTWRSLVSHTVLVLY